MLQLLPSVSRPFFRLYLLHLPFGVSHLSLSFKFLSQISPSSPFYFSLSFPSSVSPIFSSLLSPSLSATSYPPPHPPHPSALLAPFLPRPDSPSRGELRDGGSGRRPPLLPAVGKMAWPGRGEGGGGGDGNTRGLWAHSKDHSWAGERQRQRDRDAETRREHP